MVNVAKIAKENGWNREQVTRLLSHYQIPTTPEQRTEEQWQRLERLLKRVPESSVFAVGDRVKDIEQGREATIVEIEFDGEWYARLNGDLIAHWWPFRLLAPCEC